MDVQGPADGHRETETETGQDPTVRLPRPTQPGDGDVAVQGGLVAFWCGRCARWVDAHIEVDGAKEVHGRIAHPR
jgi:hypothetical protein